jgi:hypothetical protein
MAYISHLHYFLYKPFPYNMSYISYFMSNIGHMRIVDVWI